MGELTFRGLAVHKDSISVGLLEPGAEVPASDLRRRGVGAAAGRRVRRGMGWRGCWARWGSLGGSIAPSFIPTALGDRIKTDGRDGHRLARLLRSGELAFIRVLMEVEEAVRDLGRIRDDAVIDGVGRVGGWAGSCCVTGGCSATGRPRPPGTVSG